MVERCDECKAHAESWRRATSEDRTVFKLISDLISKPRAGSPVVERPCARCGTEMADLGGRSDRKYCSGACRVAAHRAQHRPPRFDRPCRPCEWCGGCMRWRRPDAKCCSNACKQAAYRASGLAESLELLATAVQLVRQADTPARVKALEESLPPELLEVARMVLEREPAGN
jgi:hypothetical protein